MTSWVSGCLGSRRGFGRSPSADLEDTAALRMDAAAAAAAAALRRAQAADLSSTHGSLRLQIGRVDRRSRCVFRPGSSCAEARLGLGARQLLISEREQRSAPAWVWLRCCCRNSFLRAVPSSAASIRKYETKSLLFLLLDFFFPL